VVEGSRRGDPNAGEEFRSQIVLRLILRRVGCKELACSRVCAFEAS
jgi:hypothetical protein